MLPGYHAKTFVLASYPVLGPPKAGPYTVYHTAFGGELSSHHPPGRGMLPLYQTFGFASGELSSDNPLKVAIAITIAIAPITIAIITYVYDLRLRRVYRAR